MAHQPTYREVLQPNLEPKQLDGALPSISTAARAWQRTCEGIGVGKTPQSMYHLVHV
jgi:hypothetical protein